MRIVEDRHPEEATQGGRRGERETESEWELIKRPIAYHFVEVSVGE